MALYVTAKLQSTYKQAASYPEHLDDSQLYLPALQAYRKRLNDASDALFDTEKNADVPFRDLDGVGSAFRMNIFTDEKLREHLGDKARVDAQGQIVGDARFEKPDPKCRFVFLWAKSSRAPLHVTHQMLTRILSYHEVMPRYLEFLFLFGQRTSPLDIRYSGFREQTQLSPAQDQMTALGRSGQRYQLCYNLKGVDCVSPPGVEMVWSIRQAAIYHSLDVKYGKTLWIITKANLDLKGRIQDVTRADGRPQDRSFASPEESFRSSLAIHVLAAHWASDNWRWYVQYLEKVVEKITRGAVSGSREAKEYRKEYTSSDLQDVQDWEEKANEASMIIDANCTVLAAIKDYYEALSKNPQLGMDVTAEVSAFTAQIKDASADQRMQSSRARLLVQIISQRKALILQHLQSQTTEKMEALTVMSQREAIAMRVITIVTVIYLPATFVSTFFSTDIVKYQDVGGGSSFSTLAMYRWLQVTLPLTFLTGVAAWYGYVRARRSVPLRDVIKEAWPDFLVQPRKRKAKA